MRKIGLFALFIIAARLFAQTPPPQFSGLMTNSTDLTCAGAVPCSTWPMPPNPGMGGSYFDPTWGTTTWEMNVPSQNTLGHVIPIYSRNQGFNSDNTKLLMFESGTNGPDVYMDLYDATTTPPTPINRITTTDGTLLNPTAGDAYWANTNPTRIYYIPWGYYSGTPDVGLQLRYVDVSTCTTSNCVLTPTIVHTFSCTADSYAPSPITPGTPGDRIESSYTGSQGNMFDLTDTYFTFGCDVGESGGVAEIDLIRYNRSTDTVTTQEKWYNLCTGGVPSGCGIWTQGAKQGYAMFRIAQHPDANYITLAWLCASDNNADVQVGCGTSAYGPTWNFLGFVSVGNFHQDDGFDVNGVPVWVGQVSAVFNTTDEYSIEVTNLTTLSTSGITSKQLQLPCTWALSGPNCTNPNLGSKFIHISMTGTWGSSTIVGVPGYALISTGTLAGENGAFNITMPVPTTLGTAVTSPGVATVTPGSMANIGVGTQQVIEQIGNANIETVTVTAVTSTTFTATFAKTHTSSAPVSELTTGDTGPYAIENLAVKIDTTLPTGASAQIWRLGRVMSIRDNDYAAEAHTFANRNWTAYVWGSNWNTDGGADNGYYTKLSTSGAGSPPSGTQVSVSASPNPGTVGQPVTLTSTITQSGSSIPTGSINFMNGSTSLGQASLDNAGTATLVLSSLSVGSYNVIASYGGDSNYTAGQSGSIALQVLSSTTASLTASPNPVGAGQTLTLTATLTGNGSVYPTGTVNFLNGSTSFGTGTLNSSGVATTTTTSPAAGTYTLTAQYGGDSNFLSTTSAGASVTVNSQPTTTTTLTASPNPVITGQTLTLTATVQGPGNTVPTGTVNFLSGSTPLGTAPVNSSGVATLTLTTLAVGTYSVTAQYSGNSSFPTSTSAAVSVTVNAQASTTSLTASPNPVTAGQNLTLTATVQGTGGTTPTGAISFMNGSTLLGTATLNSSGVATLTNSSLAAGTYSLTAQYSGNSSFVSSTSSPVSVRVNPQTGATTTTSLTASPSQIAAGQTLTLTATVQATGNTVPGGTVSFLSGSTPLGTAPVNSSGVATLTLTTLAVGSYSLTAQYPGNTSFLSSTSPAASVTVSNQATITTTSLTASPNPIATGQTLTLTATVQGTGSIAPAGSVTFMSGSTPVGTAPVNSSGIATLTITTLAVGTYGMTAQYSGDAIFLSSTSGLVSVTVSGQAAMTTTSLAASPNPVTSGQVLTLTATVQGTGSTPTGTVNFMNGTLLLGTATLDSSGVATLIVTSLAAETYSMTAIYSGDANFVSSTSAATSVTVDTPGATNNQTFTLNTTGSALSQTVTPGTSAIYTFTVSPAPGTTLPAITFTATGLPAGYTATFSPPTIAAGSGATNIALTIQVPMQTAMLERDRKLHAGLSLMAFCILLLPFGGRLRRSRKRMLQLSGMLLLLIGAASFIGLAGCTAPPGQFASQSQKTYTVTVTTTSGSQSQTANVTLIVE